MSLFLRKFIHCTALLYALIVFLFGQNILQIVLYLVLAFFILWDGFVVHRLLKVPAFNKWLIKIYKTKELNSKVSGATYLALALLLINYTLPEYIVIASIFTISFCDASANIIGKYYGRHHLVSGKTLEGSMAFLVCGVLLSFIFAVSFNVSVIVFIVAMIFATLAELFSNKLRIDDNFFVTIVFSLMCYLSQGIYNIIT